MTDLGYLPVEEDVSFRPVEDEMEKAKSFGGDRSAAGRYAAEQRWKGHVKADGKGKKTKERLDLSREVTRIMTRLGALDGVLKEAGIMFLVNGLSAEPAPTTTSPVRVPQEMVDASEEVQRLGAELLTLADQKMVADGLVSQRELDAANAEFATQDMAMRIHRGVLHALVGGDSGVGITNRVFTVSVNGVSRQFEASDRLLSLVYEYTQHTDDYEQLVKQAETPDADVVFPSDLREAKEKVRQAAYHLSNEFNAWYFTESLRNASASVSDLFQAGTTEASRMVQQARFKTLQDMLGADNFSMTRQQAESGGHVSMRYKPDQVLGLEPKDRITNPQKAEIDLFVDSTLGLMPRQALATLENAKLNISGERDGFYYYDPSANTIQIGQEVLRQTTAEKLGPDTRGAVGHEIVHAVSFADQATRALEQGALSAVRGKRTTDGYYGLMPEGRTMHAAEAAFVVDDLMDAYSGRVYQFGTIAGKGGESKARASYSATEMLSTGFEYLIGAGRIRTGYDGYLAGLAAGWMAMMVERSKEAG